MVNITIAGIDKTSLVARESLKIENVLTKEVDRCDFSIIDYGSKDYKPVIGREVIVTDNGTKIFGGVIVKITESLSVYPLVEYQVECCDYTRILDQHLISETYENKTIAEIIADFIANWLPAGFTMTQVDAPRVIKYIQFKYEPVSDCMRQLSELSGYDWYIDYDKDIFFKSTISEVAPIDVEDGNGSYENGSLVIRRDNSQLRNSIIVRGGEYLGTEFTASMEADGEQIVFDMPYKFTDFKATLTGDPLSIGIDYIGNPDSYDALYNFNEKLLRFKAADKPSAGAVLTYAGKPNLPVIVKYRDKNKINAIFSAEQHGDGEYQYLIIDKSINSKEGARQRAAAEIISYGNTLSEGEFNTEQAGFKAGQRVRINSAAMGIDEYFIINRVVSEMKDYQTMAYRISLITTKTMDFIALMKKLLLSEAKKIEIKEDEILDLVESTDEEIILSDVVETSVAHNTQNEETTLVDAATTQDLDYPVVFSIGKQLPENYKRQFNISGSVIGDEDENIWDGLTHYWKLDEASGNIIDEVGGLTGTNNSITFAGGKINNSAWANAGTDHFDFSNTDLLSGTDDFSISFWIYYTSGLFIMSRRNTYAGLDWQIVYNTKLYFQIGATAIMDEDNITLTANTWTHIVITRSGNDFKLYKNGVEVGAATKTNSIATGDSLTFFDDAAGDGLGMVGSLDEIAFFNKAISQNIIDNLYNSGAGKQYPTP